MESINILIIVSAAVFILLLWLAVGVRHLRNLKIAIKDHWELVGEKLRKRQDLVPNLVETVRLYDNGREELIGKIINVRYTAAREYNPGAKKIEHEHELTLLINELFGVGKLAPELGRDTNFLELKREIDDIEHKMEEETKKYNETVRFYNRHRGIIFLRPLSALFRYRMENIFEIEK